MKLSLPAVLLTAMLVCEHGFAAEEAVVGTPENNMGTIVVEGNGASRFIVGEVLWNTDYVYPVSGPLSIGSSEGQGSLTIAQGVQAGTGNATFIGGKGWYTTRPEGYGSLPSNEGTLTIEQGATYAVGTQVSSASGAHLDIACTPNGSGTVNVNGGTLSSDYAIYLGMAENAVGTINVTNQGVVRLAVAPHIAGLYQGIYATTFQVACFSENATGIINLEEGSTLEIVGSERGYNFNQLGEKAGSRAEINIAGGSSATFTDMYNYVGQAGTGHITVKDGSSLSFSSTGTAGAYGGGDVIMGLSEGAVGIIEVSGYDAESKVASSLTVEGTTYVGNYGDGTLAVSDGAQASLRDVAVFGESSVSVTNGSTMIAAGDVYVAETATVTVSDGVGADGAAAPSGLGVLGTYTNEGTTVLDLSQGGAFLAGAVENTGDMDVKLDKNGAFSVGSFMNEGDVSITAAEGTTCDLGNMQLRSGSMQLEGAGSFSLGSSASETVFTVTGTSAEAATSTCIDIATLGSTNFEIDTSSEFTFRFTDEIVAALHAAAADATELELTVIKGFEGFQLEQQQLDQLLQNTEYLFGDDAQSVALALEGSSEQYYGIVTNGAYQMKGNDLVWTGTVEVIPEPATVTLSLLGLAALAARRRRK